MIPRILVIVFLTVSALVALSSCVSIVYEVTGKGPEKTIWKVYKNTCSYIDDTHEQQHGIKSRKECQMTCDKNSKCKSAQYVYRRCYVSKSTRLAFYGAQKLEGKCRSSRRRYIYIKDADECQENTHKCGKYNKCVNTAGSYTCLDVDECQLNGKNLCSGEHKVCIDTYLSYKCSCKRGYYKAGKICKREELPSFQSNRSAMILVVNSLKLSQLNIVMEIRPDKDSGLILSSNYVAIALRNGFVETLSGGNVVTTAKSQKVITLYKWHRVRFSWNKTGVELMVDDQGMVNRMHNGTFESLDLEKRFYLGAVNGSKLRNKLHKIRSLTDLGYGGCVSSLVINEQAINLAHHSSDVIERNEITDCSSCDHDACRNNAMCTAQPYLTFSCSCSARFTGPYCRLPVCTSGYTRVGYKCEDVNECAFADATDLCAKRNMTCDNTVGSFRCLCHKGYHEVESQCKDEDECALKTHHCHEEKEYCSNTIGGYTCPCRKGFFENGKVCKKVPRVNWIKHHGCLKSKHYLIFKTDKQHQCKYLCQIKRNCLMVRYDTSAELCYLSANRDIKKHRGCTRNTDVFEKAIEECDGFKKKCKSYAYCQTMKQHNFCRCLFGYTGDGKICEDVNECATYDNLCESNANCINTIGSYKCVCKDGFRLNKDVCEKVRIKPVGEETRKDGTFFTILKFLRIARSSANPICICNPMTTMISFLLVQLTRCIFY